MLDIYQELIPFSNKKNRNAVSQNNSLSNPILMSTSLDITSMYTTVESVIYLRNNDPTKYYKNVLVCLMAPFAHLDVTRMLDPYGDPYPETPFRIEEIFYDSSESTLNIVDIDGLNRIKLDTEYCSEMLPPANRIDFNINDWFDGSKNSDFLPLSKELISNGVAKNAMLSYGYEELSSVKWAERSSMILIPSIGSHNYPDTSYIPIRIRIDIQQNSSMTSSLTDYALNVIYEEELEIGS